MGCRWTNQRPGLGACVRVMFRVREPSSQQLMTVCRVKYKMERIDDTTIYKITLVKVLRQVITLKRRRDKSISITMNSLNNLGSFSRPQFLASVFRP